MTTKTLCSECAAQLYEHRKFGDTLMYDDLDGPDHREFHTEDRCRWRQSVLLSQRLIDALHNLAPRLSWTREEMDEYIHAKVGK